MELKKSYWIILLIVSFVLSFLVIIFSRIAEFTPRFFPFIPWAYLVVLFAIRSLTFKKKVIYFFPVLLLFFLLMVLPFPATDHGGPISQEYLESGMLKISDDCLSNTSWISAERECGSCYGVVKNILPGLLDMETCIGHIKCSCYTFEHDCIPRIEVPCKEVNLVYM